MPGVPGGGSHLGEMGDGAGDPWVPPTPQLWDMLWRGPGRAVSLPGLPNTSEIAGCNKYPGGHPGALPPSHATLRAGYSNAARMERCSPPLTSTPSPCLLAAPCPPHPCQRCQSRLNIPNFPFALAWVKQILQGGQPGLEQTRMLQPGWHGGARQGCDAPKGKRSRGGDDAGLFSAALGDPGGPGSPAPRPWPTGCRKEGKRLCCQDAASPPWAPFPSQPSLLHLLSPTPRGPPARGATDSSYFLLQYVPVHCPQDLHPWDLCD